MTSMRCSVRALMLAPLAAAQLGWRGGWRHPRRGYHWRVSAAGAIADANRATARRYYAGGDWPLSGGR